MKKTGSRPKAKVYGCRKCNREDFKTMMKLTQHLRKCRVVDVPVTRMPLVRVPAPVTNGMREELLRLQKLSSEMYGLTVKLLKGAR